MYIAQNNYTEIYMYFVVFNNHINGKCPNYVHSPGNERQLTQANSPMAHTISAQAMLNCDNLLFFY